MPKIEPEAQARGSRDNPSLANNSYEGENHKGLVRAFARNPIHLLCILCFLVAENQIAAKGTKCTKNRACLGLTWDSSQAAKILNLSSAKYAKRGTKDRFSIQCMHLCSCRGLRVSLTASALCFLCVLCGFVVVLMRKVSKRGVRATDARLGMSSISD